MVKNITSGLDMTKGNVLSMSNTQKQAKKSAFDVLFQTPESAQVNAFIYQGRGYSYEKISSAGIRLASLISEHKSSKKQAQNPELYKDTFRIALCLTASPGAFSLLLACFINGCLCTFIEPEQSKDQKEKILHDFSPDLIVCSSQFKNTINKNLTVHSHFIQIESDDDIFKIAFTHAVCLLFPDYKTERPALIIYTSGSTGNPKGVVLSYLNLSNHESSYNLLYPAESSKNLVCLGSWQTSVLVDVIFCTRNRETFHIIDKTTTKFSTSLAAYLINYKNRDLFRGPSTYLKSDFRCKFN